MVRFNDYKSLQQFQHRVDRLPFIMQRTRIDKALKMAADVLRSTHPSYRKVAIIMTDGRQTRDPDHVKLDIASRGLHDQVTCLKWILKCLRISSNSKLPLGYPMKLGYGLLKGYNPGRKAIRR